MPLGTVAFAKFIGQLTAGLLSLLGIKGTTDMKKVFSKVVHVVSVIKGDQSDTPWSGGWPSAASTPAWMDGDLKRLAAQSQNRGRIENVP